MSKGCDLGILSLPLQGNDLLGHSLSSGRSSTLRSPKCSGKVSLERRDKVLLSMPIVTHSETGQESGTPAEVSTEVKIMGSGHFE